MYLYHNTENDLVINVEQIHFRQQLIQSFKQLFTTYGYHEIVSPSLENYDLYVNMNGTVNRSEMIKTIDNTGKVLVLRPDITIPITQLIANSNEEIHEDLRYFYIQNVFRQTHEARDYRENTQAGVEYFGNPSAHADAEVINLAIRLLQNLNLPHFKIEFGHAGFFKQLVKDMNLSKDDLKALKQSIQAKNITEIENVLSRLSIDDQTKEIVTSLPFLYGDPNHVIERAKLLPLHPSLRETLENIRDIYDVLSSYGVTKHTVIDLSLINHMDYYSDMIFQGYIDKVGKPVVMGGRYNSLAEQFDATIPAVGFAFNVDTLLEAIGSSETENVQKLDIAIIYDKKSEQRALTLAKSLRLENFRVVTYPDTMEKKRIPHVLHQLILSDSSITLINDHQTTKLTDVSEVITSLKKWR